MIQRVILGLLLAALGAGALGAQNVSDEYRNERERARFAKPHGFSFSADLFAYAPYFSQENKVRALGVDGTALGYSKDLDGVPFGVFGDFHLRARFTWWDSMEIGYSFAVLRDFDQFPDQTGFNGSTFPAGVDVDYGADFHDIHALYRRDLFRVGARSEFAFFAEVGMQWAVITESVNSDNVPALKHHGRETFRELLPWPVIGVGLEWDISEQFHVRLDGFGSYINSVSTFQKRDGEDVRQSLVSITGRGLFEWRPVPFFGLLIGARYRYEKVRLVAGFRQDNFLWSSIGPEIGVGFRF